MTPADDSTPNPSRDGPGEATGGEEGSVARNAIEGADLPTTAAPVSSTYKVLGEFDDPTGAGVLGRNTATSGTPIGVEGAVPGTSDGYGLSTPDDARLEGAIDTTGELVVTVDDDRALRVDGEAAGSGGSVVAGHSSNAVSGADGATIGGGGFDDGTTVAPNEVTADFGTIGGGRGNRVTGSLGTVGGGISNAADASTATVGGGRKNEATFTHATVAGGDSNVASGRDATVGGGRHNEATAPYSTIAGGGPADTNDPATTNNAVYDNYGTIGGGAGNRVGTDDGDTLTATFATIGGGKNNVADSNFATVGGGLDNEAGHFRSTVGGGTSNAASGNRATVAGGDGNTASGSITAIAGGIDNEASGSRAAVGGGSINEASGTHATVPGGIDNTADGDYSVAVGRKADANGRDGSVVFGDGSDDGVRADAANQFVVQAGGGVKIYTDSYTLADVGAQLPAGSGSWSSLSAAASKANVEPVDPADALEGIRDIDVATWNYRSQDESIRHMGPMAEEFHDAFGLGEDSERISTVDADGVALAAIQGLLDRLDERDERIDEQRDRMDAHEATIDEQRERIADLEETVAELREGLATSTGGQRA